MSEQKYYVKLSPEVMYYSDYGLGSIQYLEPYLNDSGDFGPAIDRTSFTKSELTEIMVGALYKKADYCKFMELPPDWEMNDENDKWLCEWINPLIELVPVEGGE